MENPPAMADPTPIDNLLWKPARMLAAGDVIDGDGGQFRVNTWEPVLPGNRVAMSLTDVATGESFDYTARWDEHYATVRPARDEPTPEQSTGPDPASRANDDDDEWAP